MIFLQFAQRSIHFGTHLKAGRPGVHGDGMFFDVMGVGNIKFFFFQLPS